MVDLLDLVANTFKILFVEHPTEIDLIECLFVDYLLQTIQFNILYQLNEILCQIVYNFVEGNLSFLDLFAELYLHKLELSCQAF